MLSDYLSLEAVGRIHNKPGRFWKCIQNCIGEPEVSRHRQGLLSKKTMNEGLNWIHLARERLQTWMLLHAVK
jgi:hypothetical protein